MNEHEWNLHFSLFIFFPSFLCVLLLLLLLCFFLLNCILFLLFMLPFIKIYIHTSIHMCPLSFCVLKTKSPLLLLLCLTVTQCRTCLIIRLHFRALSLWRVALNFNLRKSVFIYRVSNLNAWTNVWEGVFLCGQLKFVLVKRDSFLSFFFGLNYNDLQKCARSLSWFWFVWRADQVIYTRLIKKETDTYIYVFIWVHDLKCLRA